MDINFKGINNVKIAKKQYKQFGTYQNLSNELKQGEKFYTELKISAKLTDDKKGNHLSDYLKRTPEMFINKENPDTVEFHLKRFDIPEDMVYQSTFKLNNKDLVINDDKKLPMMTFLARLTRESSKNPELSENQQKYMKFANKSIHKETVDYIENR